MWKSFHTAGPVFILFRSASDRVSSVRPHRHFHWSGLRCPLQSRVSIHHRTVILPLLFLSGDADPVGEQGKGVRRAIQSLKDAGVQNMESIFYPGARHELLVETNKLEVFADIAA